MGVMTMPLDAHLSTHPLDMPDLTDYMTTQEAAEQLGYHVEHVRRMLREGDLKGKKVGYMWFIHKPSVDEYLDKTVGLEKFDPRRGNE
jgi:excisionase family DNA binding protein